MQSRVEDILQAMIDGTSSSELPKPQSRNEDLLLQVLDKMNEGGGGAVIDDTTVSTTKTWSSSKIDSTKLDANQGGGNSGKIMGVNATGDVVPVEVQGGDIAVTEAPVSGDDYAIDIVEGSSKIDVSGTTPTINGVANKRYVCGEVATISITPPASGIIDVVFTSGSTPAVLTVPNTVKWPEWFDVTALEANVTYEINILDGVYGAVTSWSI